MLSLKRCRGEFVASSTRSKKPLLVAPLSNFRKRRRKNAMFWISATHTRNYMRNDALVDWLNHLRRSGVKFGNNSYVNKVSQKDPFTTFIMNKGIEFEHDLIDNIRQKCDVVTISDEITPATCKKAIKAMKDGIPILHSVPFANQKTGTRGVIDLLVRSDHLGDLFEQNPLTKEQQTIRAPNLNGDYHYVVIDIKFSTLPLRADGTHLLNSDNFPAYKSQLYIYNQGIGAIQGFYPECSYILGRRWRYTSRGVKFYGLNCFERLGVVNFNSVDNDYVQRTEDALCWLKDLHENGLKWTVNPPSRDELRPNMCIDSGEWNQAKDAIATDIADITQVWYCGVRNREKALAEGIESWKDERCTSAILGINGSRAHIIDKILNINRQSVDKIRPAVIQTDLFDWRNLCNEMFVDFETFCDVFGDDVEYQKKTDYIFMIGVWYRNIETNLWEYKNFVATEQILEVNSIL